jgi:hypothetical protein
MRNFGIFSSVSCFYIIKIRRNSRSLGAAQAAPICSLPVHYCPLKSKRSDGASAPRGRHLAAAQRRSSLPYLQASTHRHSCAESAQRATTLRWRSCAHPCFERNSLPLMSLPSGYGGPNRLAAISIATPRKRG